MTKHAKIGGTSKCMQWKNNHNNKTEKKRKQQQRVVPRYFTWRDNSNKLIEYVYAFFARPWDSRKWTTNSILFSFKQFLQLLNLQAILLPLISDWSIELNELSELNNSIR